MTWSPVNVLDQCICPDYCCRHPFCIEGSRPASDTLTHPSYCHGRPERAHTVATGHYLRHIFCRKSGSAPLPDRLHRAWSHTVFQLFVSLSQPICGDDTSKGIFYCASRSEFERVQMVGELELVPCPRNNSPLGTLPMIVEFVSPHICPFRVVVLTPNPGPFPRPTSEEVCVDVLTPMGGKPDSLTAPT
jgi:hypothetical protein